VWQALTEREQLRSWFPSDVVDEPRLLAFTWGDETLRFELSPEGDADATRPDQD
jgi:hypothetical protein